MEKIFCIALNTFRESIRSKILYSFFVFAILLVGISAFFGTVTIGDQVKVIKDFGLFCISLFSVAYAVISGSALLHKELARKTIYNILAKSVTRWEFLLGKYFGMLLTIATLVALMGAGLLFFASLFESRIDSLLLQSYFYIFLELSIICSATIFFSSIVVTPLLSGLFTFGLFLSGRSLDSLAYFAEKGDSLFSSFILILRWILPNFQTLNISNSIVYGYSMPWDHMLWSSLYAIGYSAILILLANLIFTRREF